MYQALKKAALAAGNIQLQHFNSNLEIKEKTSQHNIVTKVDLDCQKIITRTLISELAKKGIDENEIGFIGEEDLTSNGKYLFIIDPLDGTSNYASGFPYFCVSIAFFINNIPEYGIIYNPITKEIFYAEKGKGAYKFLNSQKNKLEIKPNLKDYLMSSHLSSKQNLRQKMLNFLPKVFPLVRSNRELGSIALELCQYCENIFGLVINGNAKIWDLAAASLILSESGGNIYDWDGEKLEYDFTNPTKSYNFIACRKKDLNKIISLLN